MALFPFYKARKPREFNHKPIYYDPRKEYLDDRMRKIKRELGEEVIDENYKPQIKGTFVEGTSHLRKSLAKGDNTRSRKYKNVRLILILVLLVVVFWALFYR